MKNYRPVTLLNIISKVFEKLVLKFFSEHLLNSIASCQFGFVQLRSVILQLILSLSNIFANLSASEEFCFLLLFDFFKAFDKKISFDEEVSKDEYTTKSLFTY